MSACRKIAYGGGTLPIAIGSVWDKGYRYGFNGKEKDGDISNGCIAFEARIYDSRIGKFLSTDPREKDYSWQTPFAYYKNSPIATLDIKGMGGSKKQNTAKEEVKSSPNPKNKIQSAWWDFRLAFTRKDCIKVRTIGEKIKTSYCGKNSFSEGNSNKPAGGGKPGSSTTLPDAKTIPSTPIIPPPAPIIPNNAIQLATLTEDNYLGSNPPIPDGIAGIVNINVVIPLGASGRPQNATIYIRYVTSMADITKPPTFVDNISNAFIVRTGGGTALFNIPQVTTINQTDLGGVRVLSGNRINIQAMPNPTISGTAARDRFSII